MYLPIILAILITTSSVYLLRQFWSRELAAAGEAPSPAEGEPAVIDARKAA